MTLFDDKPKPEQERAMYISKNPEANFADFLQLHKTADNTMFDVNFIRDYTDGWGLKLLKKALFVFDKEESKHIIKVLRKKDGDILFVTNGLGDLFK